MAVDDARATGHTIPAATNLRAAWPAYGLRRSRRSGRQQTPTRSGVARAMLMAWPEPRR